MAWHTDTCMLVREPRESGQKEEGWMASIFIGLF